MHGFAVIGGTRHRVAVTITISGTLLNAPDLAELFRAPAYRRPALPVTPQLGKRTRRLVDEARSNGGTFGLPSYTERRFAACRAHAEPRRPERQQRGREALRRRKRSRDHARTGRH